MSFTFCTSGSAIDKAGANANSTLTANISKLNNFSDQVEARICAECKLDWAGEYANLSTNQKNTLQDVSSDLIAIKIINYDMSGYTSRTEAQTMLDVLSDNASKGMNALKDFNNNQINDPENS